MLFISITEYMLVGTMLMDMAGFLAAGLKCTQMGCNGRVVRTNPGSTASWDAHIEAYSSEGGAQCP